MKANFKYLLAYTGLFILGLSVIFFVGRTKDPVTKDTMFTVKANAINDFRLGMDIAGGVKLTYKLDFSDYTKTYTDKSQFENVKKETIDIISKQIDKRISGLGVSDSKTYHSVMDGVDYFVVEIGGIKDMEEAKKIIGQTITLQFKLENDSNNSTEKADRRAEFVKAFESTKTNKDIKSIFNNLNLSDKYYNDFTGQGLASLSPLYLQNISKIENAKVGDIINLNGEYTKEQSYDKNGKAQETPVNGFLMAKINKKTVNKLDKVTNQSLSETLAKYGLDSKQEFTKATDITEGKSKIVGSTIQINMGTILSGSKGYQATVYQIAKPSLIGKTTAEVNQINQDHTAIQEQIIQKLKNNEKINMSGVDLLSDNQRIEYSQLESLLGSGRVLNMGPQSFTQGLYTYVVDVKQIKNPEDNLFAIVDIISSNANAVNGSLYNTTLRDMEEIFVRDSSSRKVATDPSTNKILDAKFFNFASASTSPTGQPVVDISFNEEGKQIFCNITEKNVGKRMAIFVGDSVEPITAPTINEKICGGTAMINGSFDIASARKLSEDLNQGAFPVNMILESEENVSSVLGQEALRGAMIAGAVGILSVIILLLFFYEPKKIIVGAGFLLFYIVFLLSILKLIDYAFSLSGIAAFVLAIGMGIDANILIFERFIEEVDSGKTKLGALEVAMKRSRNPIRDGNLSTGLIALIFVLGGFSIFAGFGTMILITMSLVLVLNIYSIHHIAKNIFIGFGLIMALYSILGGNYLIAVLIMTSFCIFFIPKTFTGLLLEVIFDEKK